jgi:hypothetical protein
MDPVVISYTAYLLISIALTVWVAQTLFTNGRVFLVDVFGGNKPLADSVNHLLVVGFYLINLGFIVRGLRIYDPITNARQGMEALSDKIGIVLLTLGAMHFLNLYVFSRIRRRATIRNAPLPVAPDFTTPVGAR